MYCRDLAGRLEHLDTIPTHPMEVEGYVNNSTHHSPRRAPTAPQPCLYSLSLVVEKVVLCGRDHSGGSVCQAVLRSQLELGRHSRSLGQELARLELLLAGRPERCGDTVFSVYSLCSEAKCSGQSM